MKGRGYTNQGVAERWRSPTIQRGTVEAILSKRPQRGGGNLDNTGGGETKVCSRGVTSGEK